MAVLSKLLIGAVAAPFLFFGGAFLIGTLRSSLQGFGQEFEDESKAMFQEWYGGQPKWLTMFDPVTGYGKLLYRHPTFHIHVWLGFVWFLLGPLQLYGPSLLGADRHRKLGILLIAALVGTMLVHHRTVSIPYHARDPSLPFFFSAASAFTLIHVICAIAAIRRGDIDTHKQHMARAWWSTFMAIVGSRVVVATILPRFLKAEDFKESLIPTVIWTLYSSTQLALTICFHSKTAAA